MDSFLLMEAIADMSAQPVLVGNRPRSVSIQFITRIELTVMVGAASQSMPIVTAYDTLGEEGLRYSLKQTHAKAIFLDPHLLPKLVKPLKDATEIQFVIYNSDADVKKEYIEKLKSEHPRLEVLSLDELRRLGEENPVDPTPPKPEDLCCIMYTSGSTGAPKGVLLKHKNVIAAGE